MLNVNLANSAVLKLVNAIQLRILHLLAQIHAILNVNLANSAVLKLVNAIQLRILDLLAQIMPRFAQLLDIVAVEAWTVARGMVNASQA